MRLSHMRLGLGVSRENGTSPSTLVHMSARDPPSCLTRRFVTNVYTARLCMKICLDVVKKHNGPNT